MLETMRIFKVNWILNSLLGLFAPSYRIWEWIPVRNSVSWRNHGFLKKSWKCWMCSSLRRRLNIMYMIQNGWGISRMNLKEMYYLKTFNVSAWRIWDKLKFIMRMNHKWCSSHPIQCLTSWVRKPKIR